MSSLTRIMCPVEMSMLEETGSSHQEDVDDRPDAATLDAPDSLDSELLGFGDRTARVAGGDVEAAAPAADSRSGFSGCVCSLLRFCIRCRHRSW